MSFWFMIGMYLAIRGGVLMDIRPLDLTSFDFWAGVTMLAVGLLMAEHAIVSFVKKSR